VITYSDMDEINLYAEMFVKDLLAEVEQQMQAGREYMKEPLPEVENNGEEEEVYSQVQ